MPVGSEDAGYGVWDCGLVVVAGGRLGEEEDVPAAAAAVSSGSCVVLVLGLGVSTNIIDGPDVSSSVDTAVRGVGFEVNLGRDWRCMGSGLAAGFAREELESCEEELATLWDFGRCDACGTAVSDTLASGWGLSGVTDCVVGLSSFGVFLKMALRRSSCLEKNEVLGAVFRLRGDGIWLSGLLSSSDASRSYSSKLLPLTTASLSDATPSSSLSSPCEDG